MDACATEQMEEMETSCNIAATKAVYRELYILVEAVIYIYICQAPSRQIDTLCLHIALQHKVRLGIPCRRFYSMSTRGPKTQSQSGILLPTAMIERTACDSSDILPTHASDGRRYSPAHKVAGLWPLLHQYFKIAGLSDCQTVGVEDSRL